MKDLYQNRFLSQGYPDLERIGAEYFKEHQAIHSRYAGVIQCLERLVNLSTGLRTVAVVGCGPNPRSVKELLTKGYDAVGIEPAYRLQEAAAEFLGDPRRVLLGTAEALPLETDSQRVLLMEDVLEHVDSPILSLTEAYRVLVPGGVLYISTTNRLKFSLTGFNNEFRTRFYNWFPAILKECYVFHHLHYDPRLANFSPCPAAHWFTYAELCNLGRQVGFARFYSLLDLIEDDNQFIGQSLIRRWLIRTIKYHPWLKALALTQGGSSIFMMKRPNRVGSPRKTESELQKDRQPDRSVKLDEGKQ